MFVIKCKGQYLKIKVAEQVLELIKNKSATAVTVTQKH